MKQLDKTYRKYDWETKVDILSILCLATLIACGQLPDTADTTDSDDFFMNDCEADCGICPYCDKCMAIILEK